MIIHSMTATFGKLEHETLTLQPGLNILQAPNEWGKSTWCAFLVAMLYGIDTAERSKRDYLADKERYAPWSGSPMSGRIDLTWQNRAITIERHTKGRAILGEFRAYETETGMAVPELTAANCGQQLLGVEKSVFQRAGFIRQADLPVTQDESLRRRLNALVTTGDESGAGDDLAQKLKELKNKCRFNRTGLLPQLEAREAELTDRLNRLDYLQTQIQRIRQRQTACEQRTAQLENHRDALEYEAARGYSRKLREAQAALESAQAQWEEMDARCQGLPAREDTEKRLTTLHGLRDRADALALESRMLPPEPVAPATPAPYAGMRPEEAVAMATEGLRTWHSLESRRAYPRVILLILAGLLVAAAAFCGQTQLLPTFGCIALGAAALVPVIIFLITHLGLKKRVATLQARFAPLTPDIWISTAENWKIATESYTKDLAHWKAEYGTLQQRTEALQAQLATLAPEGLSQTTRYCQDVLTLWERLDDAGRQLRQQQALVSALGEASPQAKPPKLPDTLTYTAPETARLLSDCAVETRQLQLQLGQCQGQTEQLGDAAQLQAQLEEIRGRIQKLEAIYAAVTLAQQTLTDAAAALQRRFAPRISRRAQTLFARMTGQRYDRLTLSEDLRLQAGAVGEDTLRSTLWRSDGTTDQLYLALRLAVAGELTPQAPLVLDDALVRFDDARLEAVLDILKEEAEGRQVILFTCQGRETAMADN